MVQILLSMAMERSTSLIACEQDIQGHEFIQLFIKAIASVQQTATLLPP
jgi:hypothetical protein